MRRALMAGALLLGPTVTTFACLWDRDTPADEARGLPEVVAVIAGRFERNPPRFHEMRLERVAAHLGAHPDDLAAYDDAAVACDRLGRGDEAVAWMERKKSQLDQRDPSRPDVKEHWYRYHANLGTFLVHRWARDGGDRAKLDSVNAARDQIARALEINPDAHFGREKYQLRALEWIIDPPQSEGSQFLPNLLGWEPQPIGGHQEPDQAREAVKGLSGLIVLGNAWESVDIFYALSVALQHDTLGFAKDRNGGRNNLGYLAWLRCRELIAAGKGSLLPDAPRGDKLAALLPRPDFLRATALLDPAFVKMRAEAEAWQAARTAFMSQRLEAGRHPDTDPRFWDGYTETPAPGLPNESVPEVYGKWMVWRQRRALVLVIAVPLLLVGVFAGLALFRNSRDRKASPDPWANDGPGR